MSETVNLILQRKIEAIGFHIDRFEAWLGDELIVTSRQPIYDGARERLARGYNPDALLVARHEGAAYDAIKPAKIGDLAQWTVVERDRGGLALQKWAPFPPGGFKDARSGDG